MINPLRVRNLNNVEYTEGTVVYQMCRDLRAHDNDALLFAKELADKHKAPLIVTYVIYNYTWLGATKRFYDWVFESLQETERILRAHNIPLMVVFQNENIFKHVLQEKIPESIGAVVVEQIPLRFMDKWKERFLKHNTHHHASLYEVDSHNVVPVWLLSDKQEFAARTIRTKMHNKVSSFLDEYDKLSKHKHNDALMEDVPQVNWDEVRSKLVCREDVYLPARTTPGEKGAHDILNHFLANKLDEYDVSRNDIAIDGQSNLSPYIAHGNLSKRRVILSLLKHNNIEIKDAFDSVKNGSNGEMDSVASFIEECVIRSELAENFCYYNKNYDKVSGFPRWALEAHKKASTDKRAYIYTLEEFEQAKTHDELWNAAQLQMVLTGKMHGYLRMYWAKKILEWTKSADDALRIAITLNDTYELDGRDPNGYVGCAWSIGGLHDRPWFPRPIFGTIRYMAYSGVEKRGDVKKYIATWANELTKK